MRVEFGDRLVVLGVGRDAVVPFGDVFHEADAFAFCGVGDDGEGRAAWMIVQHVGELRNRVTIDCANCPVEGLELLVKWFVAADVFGSTGDLERVVIDDRDDLVEIVMGGGHGGFPVRTLG